MIRDYSILHIYTRNSFIKSNLDGIKLLLQLTGDTSYPRANNHYWGIKFYEDIIL